MNAGYYIYNRLMPLTSPASAVLSCLLLLPLLGQETPLWTDEDALLLSRGGYRVEQGRVFEGGAAQPLSPEDLSYALEQARSKVRLKALMELDIILNRYGPGEKMSQEDVASVRRIGRENWSLWKRDTRELLKPYFSLRELQDMPSASAGVSSKPPAQEPAAAPPLPPSPPAGTVNPRPLGTAAPLPSLPPPVPLTPLGLLKQASGPGAPGVGAAGPPPAKDEPPPLPDEAALSAAVGETPSAPAPKTLSRSPAAVPEVLPAPAAPPVVVEASSSPAAPAPAPAGVEPAPAVPTQAPPPAAVDLDTQAFASFLATAPYGRDVKPLLSLILRHGREPERKTALGIVLEHLPHITLDSTRCGTSARHALLGGGAERRQVALNDSPLFLERRRLLAKDTVWLPDSPRYYSERAMPLPRAEALSREAASEREERTDRGLTRIYKDGSMRLRLSQEQLASELLAALLELDADLRGWEPGLHTRLRSDAARLRFLRAFAKDTGKPPELDRELRAGLREWIERPEDRIDLLLQLETPQEERPGLELTILEAGGILEGQTAQALRKALPAPKTEAPLIRTGSPGARDAWLAIEAAARSEQ